MPRAKYVNNLPSVKHSFEQAVADFDCFHDSDHGPPDSQVACDVASKPGSMKKTAYRSQPNNKIANHGQSATPIQ